ncbi:MAG: HAMP domain-containing histidine kinase [Candidatus Dormibacteraeota bacterium]|nr:HAMP domain-containing histidine kinase [Candidatus Dormibacteraeota bacterium]
MPSERRRRRLARGVGWPDAAWAAFTAFGVAGLVVFRSRALVAMPLAAAMLLSLAWHTYRWLVALERLRDLSEVNERLVARQRQFIQNASHELRSPITVALGHVELIARSATGSLLDDARVAAGELMRLRRLADRLLLLATAGDPDFLRPIQVAVEPLLVETLRRWGALPRRWRLGTIEEAWVHADPDRLAVAIDALVENAVKFSSRGDVIELSARRVGSEVSISVADSGPGIPAQDLERVFDRFARFGQGARGLGLGLAIVRTIVEAHGGAVDVRSRLGEGTTFELRLPRAEPGPALQPAF